MIKRSEAFEKLKDASLRVPLLGRFFDFSKISRLLHFPRAAPGVSARRDSRAGIFRIFQYRLDILSIFLIITAAVLFAGKPGADLNPLPSITKDKPVPSVQPAEIRKEEPALVGNADQIKELKGRNIFTASGTYIEAADKKLPENPYILIGVLRGMEKKAVFRDYTGSVITLAAGKTLIDGFKIVGIDDISVRLKRRGEKKELRMFDLRKSEQTSTQAPAQAAGPQMTEDRRRGQAPVQAGTGVSEEERKRMREERVRMLEMRRNKN